MSNIYLFEIIQRDTETEREREMRIKADWRSDCSFEANETSWLLNL